MTFTEIRKRIGWTTVECAARLGVSRSTAQCWEYGRNSRGNPTCASAATLAYLTQVAEAVEAAREAHTKGHTP